MKRILLYIIPLVIGSALAFAALVPSSASAAGCPPGYIQTSLSVGGAKKYDSNTGAFEGSSGYRNGDIYCVANSADSDKVEDTAIYGLLIDIINWFTVGVLVAVVIGIVIGAIRYITSDGNPSQTQQAMSIITNAIIGLILYLFLFAIVNFLIPGGLFT